MLRGENCYRDDGALRHTLDDLILEHNASASSQTVRPRGLPDRIHQLAPRIRFAQKSHATRFVRLPARIFVIEGCYKNHGQRRTRKLELIA
jgi:hypothetical protein